MIHPGQCVPLGRHCVVCADRPEGLEIARLRAELNPAPWTIKLPSAPGWYWGHTKGGKYPPAVVEVVHSEGQSTAFGKLVLVATDGYETKLDVYDLWSGPITPPALPKE